MTSFSSKVAVGSTPYRFSIRLFVFLFQLVVGPIHHHVLIQSKQRFVYIMACGADTNFNEEEGIGNQ